MLCGMYLDADLATGVLREGGYVKTCFVRQQKQR